ncbi:MAG TPA: hypothetical protein VKX28_16625 [Xanthobacteraceae bacterium]|nr:hypothetical protein [Xanthobacteraceae bacterium]
MPLLYVPLIMYASWMELMTHPFVVPASIATDDAGEADAFAIRPRE